MHPIEFTFYKILVLIVSGLAIAFGIINLVYLNRIRLDNNCEDLSSGTALTLMWINLVLVLASGILFFWSFIRLFWTQEKPAIYKTRNTIDYPDTTPVSIPSSSSISSPVSTPVMEI